MDRTGIIAYLGTCWEKMNSYLRESLKSDIELLQAVNDSLLGNTGKMLRPLVSLLIADACTGGNVPDDAIRYAAATELLHNATLLHDDVADEADTRRGVPTLRSSLGPCAAVLVGDFWLSSAMQLVVGTKHQDKATKRFSMAMSDLAAGEMLQLEKSMSADTSVEDYLRIVRCKTASLFVVASASAAVACECSPQMLEAAHHYADALGIAFQIKDDILDYDGDGTLGKPVGIDLMEQKITLPLLCAMEGSSREQQIRQMVKDIPQHPEYCGQIRNFVHEAGGVRKASVILEAYVDKAVAALGAFPDGRAKEYLAELARYKSIRTL